MMESINREPAEVLYLRDSLGLLLQLKQTDKCNVLLCKTEMYFGPCHTSMIELFFENV